MMILEKLKYLLGGLIFTSFGTSVKIGEVSGAFADLFRAENLVHNLVIVRQGENVEAESSPSWAPYSYGINADISIITFNSRPPKCMPTDCVMLRAKPILRSTVLIAL